jgi:hypothetical protein
LLQTDFRSVFNWSIPRAEAARVAHQSSLKSHNTLAISRKAATFKPIFGGSKSALNIRQRPPLSVSALYRH